MPSRTPMGLWIGDLHLKSMTQQPQYSVVLHLSRMSELLYYYT